MNLEEINIRQLQINYSKKNPSAPLTNKEVNSLSKEMRKIFAEYFSEYDYIICDNAEFTGADEIKLKLTFNTKKCLLQINKLDKTKKIEWVFDSNSFFSNSKEASDKDKEMFKKYLKRVLDLLNEEKIKLFGKNNI